MQKDTKVQSGAFNRATNPNQWQFVGGWWWWLVVAAGSAWWRGLMAIGWLAQQWRSIGAMVAHKRRIDGAANELDLRNNDAPTIQWR